jgi:hypothetical protein
MNARHAGIAILLLLASGSALAGEPLKLVSASFMDVDAQLKSAEGHPNEEWRLLGLKSYLSGRYDEAVAKFERAASYADKPSQHYLSLIHWHGQGVPVDRVRAYVWSDLAAERGNRRLLAIREKMWAELTPQQQQQAVADGGGYYARYGDEVAKPRAEAEIRRFATRMTGSRVGYRNQGMDVINGGPINGSFGNATPGMLAASDMVAGTTTGDRMYASDRTRMGAYWTAQDREFDRSGHVEVGPARAVAEPQKSRTP